MQILLGSGALRGRKENVVLVMPGNLRALSEAAPREPKRYQVDTYSYDRINMCLEAAAKLGETKCLLLFRGHPAICGFFNNLHNMLAMGYDTAWTQCGDSAMNVTISW